MPNTQAQSSQKFVIFTLNDEEYGVDVAEVKEVVKMVEITPIPNATAAMPGFINLRGNVIPIIDMSKRINMTETQTPTADKSILVIDYPNSPFGVIVDTVLEVLTLPDSAIQKAPELIAQKTQHDFVKGVAIVLEKSQNEAEITSLAVNQDESKRAVMLVDLAKLLPK